MDPYQTPIDPSDRMPVTQRAKFEPRFNAVTESLLTKNEEGARPSKLQKTAQAVETGAQTAKVASKGVKVGGEVAKVAGQGAEVAGKAMDKGGQAAIRAGQGMMRAGMAMSGTGAGAVLGVPLAIAGGLTFGAGGAAVGAGKATNMAGQGAKKAGTAAKRAGEAGEKYSSQLGKKAGLISKALPASLGGKEKIYRISLLIGVLMIVVAGLLDLAQVGLDIIMFGFGWTLDWILDIWAWLLFYIWCKLKGVHFVSPKGLVLNGGLLLELIPWIGDLPAWTGAMLFIVISTRIEDTAGNLSETAGKLIKKSPGRAMALKSL